MAGQLRPPRRQIWPFSDAETLYYADTMRILCGYYAEGTPSENMFWVRGAPMVAGPLKGYGAWMRVKCNIILISRALWGQPSY